MDTSDQQNNFQYALLIILLKPICNNISIFIIFTQLHKTSTHIGFIKVSVKHEVVNTRCRISTCFANNGFFRVYGPYKFPEEAIVGETCRDTTCFIIITCVFFHQIVAITNLQTGNRSCVGFWKLECKMNVYLERKLQGAVLGGATLFICRI